MTLDKLFMGGALKKFIFVCIGSAIFGLSLGLFLAPNGLAPGGVGGVSVMLSAYLPFGVGSLSMLLNLPLLVIAIIKFGWRFLVSTIFSIVTYGLVADGTSLIVPVTTNPLLACIFGGALMGLGCAIIFRCGTSSGGTDIVSQLVRLKYPHLKTGTIILFVDGFISILSGFVYKNPENAMYSLIALTIFSKVVDMILYGADSARMLIIISSKSEEITDGLLHKIDVGCTIFNGYSAYSKQKSQIILCAMKKSSLPIAKKFILHTDRKAFMLVSNADEIFGEGFKTKITNN